MAAGRGQERMALYKVRQGRLQGNDDEWYTEGFLVGIGVQGKGM